MTVCASVSASPAAERGAECLDLVVAEQALRAAEANGAVVVAKQRVERLDIVRHQRALIAVECGPYLGNDIRQIDFHGSSGFRMRTSDARFSFESMTRSRIGAKRRCGASSPIERTRRPPRHPPQAAEGAGLNRRERRGD